MKRSLQIGIFVGLLIVFGAIGRSAGQQGGTAQGGSTNGVSLAPTGTNQTITPGDTTSIPLTIKEAASTSAAQDLNIVTSAGAAVFQVTPGASASITLGNGNHLLGGWGNNTFTFGTAGNDPVLVINARDTQVGGTTNERIFQKTANKDFAGVATCAASTVTVAFANAFTSTPAIFVSDETTTGGARVSTKSNAAFTVTCTGATDVLDYIVVGNPN
jgi:hypothetical protein